MDWLNYHHLLYFWVVAKEGSIVRAGKKLRLAHPTISGQIHRLEEALGVKLFRRKGRGLSLTDDGRTAFRYAEEIFSLGGEFLNTIKGRPSGRPVTLVAGISETLAKSLVYRILEPAFRLDDEVRIVCRTNLSMEAFMAELVLHTVDVILSDAPSTSESPVRCYSHLLGECSSTFFAVPSLAKRLRPRFPRSLTGIPCLLPGSKSTLRREVDDWLDANDLSPKIVAELDDTALAKDFAEAEVGVIIVPSVSEKEVRKRYNLHVIGRAEDLRQRFYAISLERKIKHPAVVAIRDRARKQLFA